MKKFKIYFNKIKKITINVIISILCRCFILNTFNNILNIDYDEDDNDDDDDIEDDDDLKNN